MKLRTFILLILVLFSLPLPAGAADGARPARDVVVRGGKDLGDLLSRGTVDAWRDPSIVRPVAIVVDVTPFTQLGHADLKNALDRLGD